MSSQRPGSEPTPANVSRRTLLGSAAGAVLLPLAQLSVEAQDRKRTEAELAEWRRSLFGEAPPITYRASTRPMALFPTGGVGAGNVYIGVGGHLRDWLIFNNTAPVQVPNTFFGIRARAEGAEPVARMLQTETLGQQTIGQFGSTFESGTQRVRAPGASIRDTELVGEYPTATLRYLDPALPVEVSLEAFTPFIPLEARSSAYPGAVFAFKIRNPGKTAVDVSLLATLHNAAGLGQPAKRAQEPLRSGPARGVRLRVLPGEAARLSGPLELVAAAPGLALPGLERPEALTFRATANTTVSASELKRQGAHPLVVWMEDPDSLDAAGAAALRAQVEAGATLVLTGAGAGLLSDWAANQAPRESARPDVIFEDFESGTYAKWKVEGTAFGPGPQTGTLAGQQQVSGWRGKYLVNSFTAGDAPTGKLTSAPFRIERRFLKLLIGGGAHPGRTCINLLIDGKVARTATGKELERLEPHSWDLTGLEGQEARLEIVDHESGGWGHINIDDIVFSDRPGADLPDRVMEDLGALLPVAIGRVENAAGTLRLDLPARGAAAAGTLELPSAVRYPSARLQPDSQVLASTGGTPVLWERKVGAGRVLLLAAPLLPAAARGDRAARTRAMRFLAYAAGVEYREGEGIHKEDPTFGELSLTTTARETSTSAWSDPAALWRQFEASGGVGEGGSGENAALAVKVHLKPGGEATVPLFLTWHFPNYYFQGRRVGNRYTQFWTDSAHTARDLAENWKGLRERTERYRKTTYDTTHPYWLTDCLTSQTSTIASEVCVWLEDGTFAGYEGADGCCPMNCSHVWGYEQSLSRLFPDLEKRMRQADLHHQQRADGGINNRIALPLQPGPTGEMPFADGHASGILKAYREHLNSPDIAWLREYWPRIKAAVGYLLQLDGDPPDGILEGIQWNTYDCPVFGPNSFIGTYYLAALRAGEEMARLMGESTTADRWRSVFESGRKRLVELCWNGEYFYQNLPDYTSRTTQYGPGCLADQLIGQWWAHQLRLGYLLPREMVRSALQAVFRYNWMWDLSDFRHRQRVFADRHDMGLLNCTWPRGGRPANPILYCDEVWTGVEYQVAGHMAYEGMLEPAFTIVRGARERYDGRRRNPWNEIECGGHYARALASWSLLLALSGFHHDGPQGLLRFEPIYRPEQYRALFTSAEGWGGFSQERSAGRQHNEVRLDHGRLRLRELQLGVAGAPQEVRVRKNRRRAEAIIHAQGNHLSIRVAKELLLEAGDTLEVELT
jgi:uncharacterized protein (DUF608 family)